MLDIVVYADDAEKLKKTIDGITRSDLYKKGTTAVYVLDASGEQNEYPGNMKYLDAAELTQAQAYNLALSKAEGDSVIFLSEECSCDDGVLAAAADAADKYGIVSLHPYGMNEGKKSSYIPGEFTRGFGEETVVSLELNPEKFHLCFSAYVFSRDVLEGLTFDENMPYDSELKLLLTVLDKQKSYCFVNKALICYEPNENDYFNFQPQFDKQWYLGVMDSFLIDAVKENDSCFKQRFVLYMLVCRYACNMNERDKSVLSPDEAEEFIRKSSDVLRNIDDRIISNNLLNGKSRVPQFFALNLLRMKYKDDKLLPQIVSNGRTLNAYINDGLIWTLSGCKIEIKVIYFDGENLTMDGFFPGVYVFGEDEIEITAVFNTGREYPVRRNHIYALNKFFNLSAKGNYTFHFSVPVSELEDVRNIAFYLKYRGDSYLLEETFIRAQAKLGSFDSSYWVFDDYILSYNSKSRMFIIDKLTKKALIKHERKFIRTIRRKTSGMWRIKMVGHRLLYWFTKPFYSKKKIWLTMDKLFKAGDNGEYFYRYVKKQNPKGIKIYYVVQKDSPDYKRLKKEYNTIIKFNSLHHKLLALHTDLMLATHVDTFICNGYYSATKKYFQDLYNARVVCLAHGLTIQKIAQYQNRTFDNTVLYFFASKYEVSNVKHEVYDYYDDSALQLTGHARYDGLVNNDQKIILITPTWRRGVTTGKASKGTTYAHSNSFKNSEYFKIYNSLINDREFLECAEQNGYRIVYLLHPAMSNQLEDFDKNDKVEIVAATSDISYEKILTEASLMVTDYSGVQFDFAYMKKPLVYYHPASLPPQYEAGGLDYPTMGFGPICENHEQIISTLCEYIRGGCVMPEEYKRRVDDFYCYSDHNNCARIYEKVMEFQSKFDKINKHNYKK